MKFQLCSDIKIRSLKEGKDFTKYLAPSADILLICGNIIRPNNICYTKFLRYLDEKFKKVFIIPGRYEYSNLNKNMKSLDEVLIKKIEKFDNIHLLDNEIFETDSFIIFGTLFWSDINGINQNNIIKKINDFKNIYVGDKKKNITIANINDYYNESKKFIIENLEKYKNSTKKKILLTNFIPLKVETFIEQVNNDLTIDDLLEELSLIEKEPTILSDVETYDYYFTDDVELCKNFDLCCFGNFTSSLNFSIEGTKFATNCGRKNNKFIVEC